MASNDCKMNELPPGTGGTETKRGLRELVAEEDTPKELRENSADFRRGDEEAVDGITIAQGPRRRFQTVSNSNLMYKNSLDCVR